MKTYSTTPKDIKRAWHLVDVKGKVLGRVCTDIAQKLIGKTKPYFVTHLDCGDYVVVEYNGDVYPCDFYVQKDLLLGNLHEGKLEQMASSPTAGAFRKRKRHGDPACESCRWRHICNHGCPLMRDHNPDGGQHYLCPAYQQLFAYAEQRLKDLSKQVPPPAPSQEPVPSTEPVGRNDPCPCGSGKKYKKCCGGRH